MQDELSQMEDELSSLTKRLQEEGESDEITLGLDKILGRLADHLLKEESKPNLMERIAIRMAGFFTGILRRL